MSGKRLRSGKTPLVPQPQKSCEEREDEENVLSTSKHVESDTTTAEVLKELKSMRSELTVQMRKLGEDLTNFQQETNVRLTKIESVMSKIDVIDNLNVKAKELDEEFHRMKDSLTSTNTSVEELDSKMVDLRNRLQNSNIDLRNRMENLERYSRDFNIRVIGVIEEEGEDCMAIVLNILTLLGFEDALGEIENAHRTGKKHDDKPRHIIVKLYSRPFKRSLLRVAKKKKQKKKRYAFWNTLGRRLHSWRL